MNYEQEAERVKNTYDVHVSLIGQDSNVFNLIGITTGAMRRAKVPKADISTFVDHVTSSGSFDEAVNVITEWVHTDVS